MALAPTLATMVAAVLMVIAGMSKRQFSWRPPSARRLRWETPLLIFRMRGGRRSRR